LLQNKRGGDKEEEEEEYLASTTVEQSSQRHWQWRLWKSSDMMLATKWLVV
jgi:hypothetical protein